MIPEENFFPTVWPTRAHASKPFPEAMASRPTGLAAPRSILSVVVLFPEILLVVSLLLHLCRTPHLLNLRFVYRPKSHPAAAAPARQPAAPERQRQSPARPLGTPL